MRFNTVFTGSVLLLGYGVFAATVSQNARCGKDFGGIVCPGRSSSVGPCCSQYGWCGRTENHCYVSSGCQSGFGSCSTSSGSKQPSTSSPSPTPSKLKISADGKCGAGSSQTCLSSVFGNCCSQYGYCGSSNSYCKSGCQTKFGSCKDTPSSPSSIIVPPSSAITNPIASASAISQRVSTNARCGASFGGQTCKGSKWGNCCSQYSYCGSTDAYCAPETCQKGFGDCNAASSSSTAPASTTSHSSAETTSTITSSTSSPAVTPEAVSSSPSSSPVASSDTSSSAFSETSTSVSVSSTELVSSSTSTTSTSTSIEASSTTSEIASTTTLESSSSSTSPTPTPTPSPSPSPPEPSQLLPNSGFEDPTTSPWVLFPADAAIAAPSDPQYGSKSVRVTRRAGLFASVRQVVSITVAGTYTASFSVKVDGTVGIPCYISLTGYMEKAYGLVEVQEWTRFSETTALPVSSGNYVRIVVSCSQIAQTGSVWFDDITLTRVG